MKAQLTAATLSKLTYERALKGYMRMGYTRAQAEMKAAAIAKPPKK